jgi:hypothetical protein
MPDEVPALVTDFLAWLSASVAAAEAAIGREEVSPGAAAAAATAAAAAAATTTATPPAGPSAALERALALACDAHTR